jgi:hypothetical protein
VPGISGLHERLTDLRKASPRLDVSVNGKMIPWPAQPMHFLDFGQLEGFEIVRHPS